MSKRRVFLILASIILLSFTDVSQVLGQSRRVHRQLPRRGERIAVVHYKPGVVITYAGKQYHYEKGIFYRPMGTYVEVVAPPIGIRVRTLPPGYRRVLLGPTVVFYFNGVFYRSINSDEYEVIQPPIGAEVPELPEGTRVLVINGQKLFELDGTYYKEEIRDGQIWYRVTGKDGVVSTENYYAQNVGDILKELPRGCKPVIINNQKYYVSPDGVYYQEIIEDNELFYTVVGK